MIPNCLRGQIKVLVRGLKSKEASRRIDVGTRSIRARIRALLGSGNEGGAIVEMALILPILLAVTTGMLIFGIALANYMILNQATTTGAQLLAVSRGQTLDPCNLAVTAIYAAAPTMTQSKFTFKFVLNGSSFNGTSCSSSSTTTGAAGDLVQGKSATVTVTYPCSLAIYGTNYGSGGCTLQAQTTEIIQ